MNGKEKKKKIITFLRGENAVKKKQKNEYDTKISDENIRGEHEFNAFRQSGNKAK